MFILNSSLSIGLFAIFAVIFPTSVNAEVKYSADLSGFSEVPQIFSQGTGIAIIKGNGTLLNYVVNTTGVLNVTAATINKGEETENGEVLVKLLIRNMSVGGNHEGIIKGTINNSSLLGPLAGKSIKDFVDLINQNATYINVNTTKFPQGELRGTIVNNGNSTVITGN